MFGEVDRSIIPRFGGMALLGFDFPGDFQGMSDFTHGVLLKLVLWTLYISSENVSIPSGKKLSSR